MHDLELILTLAGGFTAALILGYFTQRAGLSPIVGYLLAGTLASRVVRRGAAGCRRRGMT